jgi:iduronate 2-sulfatase
LADLPKPEHLEGHSLVPVLRDPAATVKPTAFTQHPRPAYYKGTPEAMGYSMRTATVRYTEWRDWKTGKLIGRELYDHVRDPGENINIAAGRSDLVKQMAKDMAKQFPAQRHP